MLDYPHSKVCWQKDSMTHPQQRVGVGIIIVHRNCYKGNMCIFLHVFLSKIFSCCPDKQLDRFIMANAINGSILKQQKSIKKNTS